MKPRASHDHRFLAARYLRKQVKQIRRQFDGIRSAEDVEFVHRARVASRRLRAALQMLDDAFPKKTVKRWRKEIRRVARKLGAARDKDVQIEFLSGQLCKLEDRAHYPGIARLLVKLEHERESLQPQVLEALERLQTSQVLKEIRSTARAMQPESEAPESEGPAGGAASRGLPQPLGRQILDRLGEFLAHQDCLSRPEDREAHHAMRIAAKHLRYTIEVCSPACPRPLDAYLSAVKEIQTLLGEIHDCDVWDEQLQAFLDAERRWIVACFGHDAPLARLQVGIDHLRQDRRRHRGEQFARLVAYWEDLARQEFWAGLIEMVQVPAGLPASSQNEAASEEPATAGPRPGRSQQPPTHEPNGAAKRCGEPAEQAPPRAGSQ